ncbi:MAG TPA: MFS transporter [Steroidobacteraceae bacterium]|nr:MFS transporter [Steroidobacteraceae bacterium]
MRHILTIAFVGLSGFVMMSDFSSLSVALPSISRQLQMTPTALSLIGSMSTLMFASFLILGGRLIDIYGAVRTCAAGLVLYLLGSLVAASAAGAAMLIAARALQGLGFALLGPAGFSKLNTGLPAGPIRNRGVGIYAAAQGAAMIAGSVCGGAITTYFGWRAVFLMNVATVIVTLGLAFVLLRREPEITRPGSLDVFGSVLIATSTALLVWALTKVGQVSWSSPEVPLTLGGGLVGYLAFALYERTLAQPLIPLGLFREKRMIANTLATLGIMVAAAAMFILPNLYMQRVMGFSAAQSGFGMLPQALTNITNGGLLAYAIGRFSFRQNLAIASAVYVTGLSLFLLLPLFMPNAGYAVLIGVPLVLASFGGPFGAFAILANSTANSPAHQQGMVTSVVMSSQQIGLAFGVAMVLTIAASGEALGAGVAMSLRYGYVACLGAALFGAICALGGRHQHVAGTRANVAV